MEELLKKIKTCKSVPELDALRTDCVVAFSKGDKNAFLTIQGAFIKKMRKLRRVPLMDRNW
jgi:hypothetical protein